MHREQRRRDFREDDRPRRRKKKKKKSIWTPILLLLVLALLGIIAFFVYREYRDSKEPITQTIDLTDKATAMSLVWLGQIDDNGLNYDDVKSYMDGITITVVLQPTGKKSMYSQTIQESDYELCLEKARQGLKLAFIKAVENRLEASGYEGDIDEEKVEELMQTAFGVSIDEYLEQCDVQLLPSWEEMSEKYSGEVEHER